MSGSERNPEQCLILHIKSTSAHTSATTALPAPYPVVPPKPLDRNQRQVVDVIQQHPGPTQDLQRDNNLPKCFQNKRKSSKGLVEEAAHCPVSLPGRPPTPGPPFACAPGILSATSQKYQTANQTALQLRQSLDSKTRQLATDKVSVEGLSTAQLPGIDGHPHVMRSPDPVRLDNTDSFNFTQNPAKINKNARNGGPGGKTVDQVKPCDQLPSPCVLQSDTYLENTRQNVCLLNSEKITNNRRHCNSKVSILEEVLSWRRTANKRPPWTSFERPRNNVIQQSFKRKPSIIPNSLSTCFFRSILLLLSICPMLVFASEFPQRECCDNPLYKFDPPPSNTRTTFLPPRIAYPPPEVPDFPEYGPEVPPRLPGPGYDSGVYTTPAAGSLGCLLARTLCTEDSACNQILQVIPRVCGLELVSCSTPTVTKCQAALRTLQSFPFFNPTCLCKEPRLDPDCNQFKDFLIDHPCLNAKYKEKDPFPVDALPTCDHAQDVCNADKVCTKKVQSFKKNCPVRNDQCIMTDVPSCHGSWQNLRQSPIFGCICPSNMPNKKNCDQIFKVVNGNDCIDAQLPDTLRVVYTNFAKASKFWTFWYQNLSGSGSGGGGRDRIGHTHRTTRQTVSVDESTKPSTPYYLPTTVDRNRGEQKTSQQDQEIVNLRSTCHLAMDRCERDSNCRPYLESIKTRCVDSCSRDRCMAAVKEFYRKIPKQHQLDVAFCLCKKNGADDQCFRAQSVLHPPCAQTPASWSGREEDLPSCHLLARSCRESKNCRRSLERYEQACSVDSDTKTCAGTYTACREAMVEILGTDLRTNCACSGTAGDFRELFECIEYQRLFWVNPCVVDAQKDYHLKLENTRDWTRNPYTPTIYTPSKTLPPRRTTPRRPNKTRPPPEIEKTTKEEIKTVTTVSPVTKKEIVKTTTEEIKVVTTVAPVTQVPTRTKTTPTTTERIIVPVMTPAWTAPTPPPRTTRLTRKPYRPTRPPSPNVTPTSPKSTTTTLPPRYCNLAYPNFTDGNVKYIREGFEKRLYDDDPTKSGSRLCGCNAGPELKCTWLEEIEKKPCNTESAFYSHASPFYLAYRGQCLCYSGEFICAKHDTSKGCKKGDRKCQVAESPPGVYLYLGYSKKDSLILQRGRVKLGKDVPDTDEEEKNEVKNTVQQTVSHFTSNTNKSDCRINLVDRTGENYILKATLDEFDEYRMKKNMSDEMKYKEKAECFAALESIAQKVNERDADMRSHIVLSMFKVAAAEANVPEPPPDGAPTFGPSKQVLFLTVIFSLTISRFFSGPCSFSSNL